MQIVVSALCLVSISGVNIVLQVISYVKDVSKHSVYTILTLISRRVQGALYQTA